MNIYFDVSTITRAINTHGQEFSFKHHYKNTFGEPDAEFTTITVKGLFHQTRGYIQKTTSDGSITRSKPQPQILSLVNEDSSALILDDILEYKDHTYRVTGVNDINNLGIALDISLEMIDDGS